MIGPIFPVAVQVIEAQQKPLVLHLTSQKIAHVTEIDTKSTPNTIYVGQAPVGTFKNAPGWTITRTIFTPQGIRLSVAKATGIFANCTTLYYIPIE
jgi:hypothetical protein